MSHLNPTPPDQLVDSRRQPYFLWDRRMSEAELRQILIDAAHPEHVDMLALLLREARPDEVWMYITPAQVAAEWPSVAPRLGRRRSFWGWLLEGWRKLGFLN